MKKIIALLKTALIMILNIALGAGMALAVIPWASAHFADSVIAFEAALFAAMAVCGFVCWMVMVVLHEAGHLVAGLCSGYTFVSFRISSFMLVRLDDRLCLKRFSLAGTGGQCLMKPPAWTENGIPVRLYNMGGVMANAVLCLLSAIGVALLPVETIAGMFALMMLIVNGYALLANGLPLQNNDGDNALNLAGNRDAQYAFWQQMMAHALLTEGVRQRDLPPELYALPADPDLSNPLIAATAVNAAQLHLIRRDFDAARTAIDALLHHDDIALPPAHRFLLQNDRLYLELIGENNPETIAAVKDKSFAKYRKAMARMPAVIRTQYAEALAAHDDAAAARCLAAFDHTAKTYPYEDELNEERQLMAETSQRFS